MLLFVDTRGVKEKRRVNDEAEKRKPFLNISSHPLMHDSVLFHIVKYALGCSVIGNALSMQMASTPDPCLLVGQKFWTINAIENSEMPCFSILCHHCFNGEFDEAKRTVQHSGFKINEFCILLYNYSWVGYLSFHYTLTSKSFRRDRLKILEFMLSEDARLINTLTKEAEPRSPLGIAIENRYISMSFLLHMVLRLGARLTKREYTLLRSADSRLLHALEETVNGYRVLGLPNLDCSDRVYLRM